MCNNVLVVSADGDFAGKVRDRASHCKVAVVVQTSVSTDTESIAGEVDLVILDCKVLPAPDSARLTRLAKALRHRRAIVVYDQYTNISLDDVRAAFIAGTRSLVPKPTSDEAVATLLATSC